MKTITLAIFAAFVIECVLLRDVCTGKLNRFFLNLWYFVTFVLLLITSASAVNFVLGRPEVKGRSDFFEVMHLMKGIVLIMCGEELGEKWPARTPVTIMAH